MNLKTWIKSLNEDEREAVDSAVDTILEKWNESPESWRASFDPSDPFPDTLLEWERLAKETILNHCFTVTPERLINLAQTAVNDVLDRL